MEIEYDKDKACECCGAKGAYDFFDEWLCLACTEIVRAGYEEEDYLMDLAQ